MNTNTTTLAQAFDTLTAALPTPGAVRATWLDGSIESLTITDSGRETIVGPHNVDRIVGFFA